MGTMTRFLIGTAVVCLLLLAWVMASTLVTWLSGYPQVLP